MHTAGQAVVQRWRIRGLHCHVRETPFDIARQQVCSGVENTANQQTGIAYQAFMSTGRMTASVTAAAYKEWSPLGELSCSALPEPFLLGGVRGRSRARAFAASSSCLCSSSNLSISEEKTVIRLCQLTSPGPTIAHMIMHTITDNHNHH